MTQSQFGPTHAQGRLGLTRKCGFWQDNKRRSAVGYTDPDYFAELAMYTQTHIRALIYFILETCSFGDVLDQGMLLPVLLIMSPFLWIRILSTQSSSAKERPDLT